MPGFQVPNPGGGTFGGVGNAADGRRDFFYTYTWEIEQIIGQWPSAGSSANTAIIYARETTLPTFTVNKESVFGASLEYKFAKNVTWDDIKVTWYDTLGLVDMMRRWRRSVWDEVNGLRAADEHKRNSILTTFLPDVSSFNRWLLLNSWPSQIRYGDLTYTTSEAKIIEVTVTYDWAEENDTAAGTDTTRPPTTSSPGETEEAFDPVAGFNST